MEESWESTDSYVGNNILASLKAEGWQKLFHLPGLASLLFAGMIEAFSLLYWVSFPYLQVLSTFRQIDAAFLGILLPLSPVLLVFLSYSWVGVLLVQSNSRVSKWLKIYFSSFSTFVASLRLPLILQTRMNFGIVNYPRILVAIGIAVAAFLGVIPYRADLNPEGTPVGVDFHYYVEWIGPMLGRSFVGALSYAMGVASFGSRPLLLIPMYLLVSTGMVSLIQTVKALPSILSPLLVLSIFIFTREALKDEKIAGISALLTAFSFYITVGIWAGYYANMLALIITFLFLTLFFSYSKQSSTTKLVLLLVTSLGLLLSHPWTWIVILSATTLFTITRWIDTRKLTLVKPLILVLAVDLLVDFARSQVFGGYAAAQDATSSIPGSSVSPILNFWPNIIKALILPYDGLMANTVILAFSLFAVLSFSFKNPVERFFLIWIAVSSIPVLVITPLLQTRVIYDLPFPIFTTIGLVAITNHIGNRPWVSNLFFLLVILVLANYAFRAVTNLVVTVPS